MRSIGTSPWGPGGAWRGALHVVVSQIFTKCPGGLHNKISMGAEGPVALYKTSSALGNRHAQFASAHGSLSAPQLLLWQYFIPYS